MRKMKSHSLACCIWACVLLALVNAYTRMPFTPQRMAATSNMMNVANTGPSSQHTRVYMMMDIAEFGDEEGSGDDGDNRTDQEKGLTHGYEGEFKVGDKVKVMINTTMYAKPLDKLGFNPLGE